MLSWIYTWKVHIYLKYLYNISKTQVLREIIKSQLSLMLESTQNCVFKWNCGKLQSNIEDTTAIAAVTIWCRDNKNLHIVVKIIIEMPFL